MGRVLLAGTAAAGISRALVGEAGADLCLLGSKRTRNRQMGSSLIGSCLLGSYHAAVTHTHLTATSDSQEIPSLTQSSKRESWLPLLFKAPR
jgi:hypothetical protein